MKLFTTILFTLVVAAVGLFAQQVPNGAFDQWSNQQPASWNSLNNSTLSGGVVTCQQGICTAGSGCENSYYLNLTSEQNSEGTVVTGIAVCGSLNANSFVPTNNYQPVSGGFPFTQRPTSLTGNWQYMAMGNSHGYINVILTRWDTVHAKRITVGSAHHVLSGMAMSWAKFSIPITYDTTATPDTCKIVLSASGSPAEQLDYLYINALGFDNVVEAVQQYITNNSISIFPNPATVEITINTANSSNKEDLQLLIFDVVGTLVQSATLNQYQQKVSVAGLSNGCYIVTIKSNGFTSNQRLIVHR